MNAGQNQFPPDEFDQNRFSLVLNETPIAHKVPQGRLILDAHSF